MVKAFIACDALADTQPFMSRDGCKRRYSSVQVSVGRTTCIHPDSFTWSWAVMVTLRIPRQKSAFPCSVLLPLAFPYRIAMPFPCGLRFGSVGVTRLENTPHVHQSRSGRQMLSDSLKLPSCFVCVTDVLKLCRPQVK